MEARYDVDWAGFRVVVQEAVNHGAVLSVVVRCADLLAASMAAFLVLVWVTETVALPAVVVGAT